MPFSILYYYRLSFKCEVRLEFSCLSTNCVLYREPVVVARHWLPVERTIPSVRFRACADLFQQLAVTVEDVNHSRLIPQSEWLPVIMITIPVRCKEVREVYRAHILKIKYQVKRGDTLASIARVFSTSVSAIKTWNRIPGSTIRTGERLTIYTARAAN